MAKAKALGEWYPGMWALKQHMADAVRSMKQPPFRCYMNSVRPFLSVGLHG